MRRLLGILILLTLVGAALYFSATCEREDLPAPKDPNGVTLLTSTLCSPATANGKCPAESVAFTAEGDAVVVAVTTQVECTDRYQFPRLTDDAGLHTLILEPQPRPWKRALFGLLGNDCTKSMAFKLSGRVRPGENVFVTNLGRVVGYGSIAPTR